MKKNITNPAFFRLKTLLALGISQVHEFARTAVATLTTFRVILGRCLLAMRETKGFKKFGCSSEIHYATTKLGLGEGVARDCRKVARCLLELPELTLAAENGWIEWGKLREIAPKATIETEVYWLKLAKDLNYKQIEKLANKTPKGGLPGDVFEESERQTSELRCKLSDEVLAMLDQARRLYSVDQGQAVTTAEVLEYALASYISNQPIDQDSLAKVRQEMDRDLQAQKAREIPLVAVARGVAAEMGFIPIPEAEEVSRAGCGEPSKGKAIARTGKDGGASKNEAASCIGEASETEAASRSGNNGGSQENATMSRNDNIVGVLGIETVSRTGNFVGAPGDETTSRTGNFVGAPGDEITSRTGNNSGAPGDETTSRTGNIIGAPGVEIVPRTGNHAKAPGNENLSRPGHQACPGKDARNSGSGWETGLRQRAAGLNEEGLDLADRALGALVCPKPESPYRSPGKTPAPKSEPIDALTLALGASPSPDLLPASVDKIARAGQNDHLTGPGQQNAYSHLNGVELLKLNDPAEAEALLQQNQLSAVSNKRVCFNPLNRHTTKAQKREVLRRDGWCCAVPGCPHRVFLHLHHLIPFSQGGPTIDKALLGLCTACHCNVHDGLLRIFQQADGSLLFTDAEGKSLAKQADLELGRWLDFNIGWKGEEDDSFTWRAFQGKWSVYGNVPAAAG